MKRTEYNFETFKQKENPDFFFPIAKKAPAFNVVVVYSSVVPQAKVEYNLAYRTGIDYNSVGWRLGEARNQSTLF